MARKARIHYEGALYHVICRGNNRDWIFKEQSDKMKYLELIKYYKEKYQFKLYAYCIMDNHVHLLIEVGMVPLSKIMQGIQLVFTQRYNKNNNRVGHVFEQRYKAVLCDKDQYLLGLINYIHMNSVKTNLKDGINYKWSSHQYYLKGDKENFVDIRFPLSLFEGDLNQQRKRYLNFMSTEDTQIITMKPSELSENIDEYEIRKAMNEKIEKQEFEKAENVMERVCNEAKVSIEDLRIKTKKPEIVKAKRIAIYTLKELTNISNTEISIQVNVSMTTVTTTLGNEILRNRMKEELLRIRQSKT